MDTRLASHNTSHPDNLELILAFKTDEPGRVEACLSGLLKNKRYRANREFFVNIDPSKIIELLEGCHNLTIISN